MYMPNRLNKHRVLSGIWSVRRHLEEENHGVSALVCFLCILLTNWPLLPRPLSECEHSVSLSPANEANSTLRTGHLSLWYLS